MTFYIIKYEWLSGRVCDKECFLHIHACINKSADKCHTHTHTHTHIHKHTLTYTRAHTHAQAHIHTQDDVCVYNLTLRILVPLITGLCSSSSHTSRPVDLLTVTGLILVCQVRQINGLISLVCQVWHVYQVRLINWLTSAYSSTGW